MISIDVSGTRFSFWMSWITIGIDSSSFLTGIIKLKIRKNLITMKSMIEYIRHYEKFPI
jgi:hypothetical protein